MAIVVDIPDADLRAAFFDATASVAQRALILQIQVLRLTIKQGTEIMATLAELTQAVHDATTQEEKAIVLITGFSAQLQAAITAGADPAALQALKDELDAETAKLAAAMATVPA